MSQKNNTALKYVPGQVNELIRVNREIDNLVSHADDLGERVALDIIDGWSTGDELQDFVLVACDGNYDNFVLNTLYRPLQELGLRRPGQKILIIQKAIHHNDGGTYLVKNIHLASIRKDVLETDIDSLSMRFPVNPGYLTWYEFLNLDEGFLASGHKIFRENWLRTGPIWNEFCDYSHANLKDGTLTVPADAVCEIELIPESDKLDLFLCHDIDSDLLSHLTKTWIRGLSKP